MHWMLPRAYRSGTSKSINNDKQDLRQPKYRTVPDRWLIVRRIHPGFQPSDAISTGLKEITAWVVESNRLRNIQEFHLDEDIELECAPFINGSPDIESVDSQAEVFIGRSTEISKWNENWPAEKDQYIPVTVVGAANPLFADYVAHNSNVFSMFDNFGWQKSHNSDQTWQHLTQATASYSVVGWHSDPSADPMTNSGAPVTLKSILKDLNWDIKVSPKGGIDDDINSWDHSRVVLHGSIYTVEYTANGSTDIKVPANRAAQKLSDPFSHPVTVGTNSLDAVLAYLRAHQDELKAQTGENIDKSDLKNAEANILLLQTLLLKQDEEIDAQQEAFDMLSANNFQPAADSGSHWHFSAAQNSLPGGVSKSPVNNFTPSPQHIKDLAALNAAQESLDAANRELRAERWNLFAIWWKFIADPAWQLAAFRTRFASFRDDQVRLVKNLQAKRDVLVQLVNKCLAPLGGLETDLTKQMVQKGSQPRFYTQKDPTILVPGIPNPWPIDWLDSLPTRLSSQILPKEVPQQLTANWNGLRDIQKEVSGRVGYLQQPINRLLAEFYYLHPKDTPQDTWNPVSEGVLPLYRDYFAGHQRIEGLNTDGTARDQWSGAQPYFPLFLEWEVRYYEIPFASWTFIEVDSHPIPGNPKHWRYGIKDGEAVEVLSDDDPDRQPPEERVISGRVLILPQPGFQLNTAIQQLLKSSSRDDIPASLKDDDEKVEQELRTNFLTQVKQIEYLSAPLAGFQDHLVTRLNGTHLKPSYRQPGSPIVPFKAAVEATEKRAKIGYDEIVLMDTETNKVPFANHVLFEDDIAPLKPGTHGQFKFTRLDIFDKFGQVISAIDPSPANFIPPLYPVLSEYFHPQHHSYDPKAADFGLAKTVGKNEYGKCQFAQYPPTINQDARLHASFLVWDQDAKPGNGNAGLWRPCTEWENPIWGYVVVNYAEYAVQLFLPDGQFYREVRLGGPNGTTTGLSWVPFEQPTNTLNGSPQYVQLDSLLQKFQDRTYVESFIRMINASLESVAHTPNSYADYLSSIVGRPLALANFGYSLELAEEPYLNQSTDPRGVDPPKPITQHDFSIKIGDKDRVYDGLVGYFEHAENWQTFGKELELKKIYTYSPDGDSQWTTEITQSNLPKIRPYHHKLGSPDLNSAVTTDLTEAGQNATDLMYSHSSKLRLAGALFDPFSKIHLYSGILPIATLQLPPWALQSALESMTAFFSMGPLLITTPDLQTRYSEKRNLTNQTNLAALAEVDSTTDDKAEVDPNAASPFKGIPIPAIRSADWNWLQPFARDPVKASPSAASTAPATAPAPGTDQRTTHWNPFEIAHLDNRPKFERGPYTAIEGYLQLKKPIMSQDNGSGK